MISLVELLFGLNLSNLNLKNCLTRDWALSLPPAASWTRRRGRGPLGGGGGFSDDIGEQSRD